MEITELQKKLTHELEELKAMDVTILDVHLLTDIADCMIICTGRSSRHIQAIADNLVEKLKHTEHKPLRLEGKNSDWILIDFGNIVVHMMLPPSRALYALEDLWGKNGH